MATAEETRALDDVKESLEKLNEASRTLGATPGDGGEADPFAGLAGSPALDRLEVGKGLLEDDELTAIVGKVEAAKTDNERFAEVVAFLARLGVAAGKAIG